MSSNVGSHRKPFFVVVMGVSGTGKSTLGAALAHAMGVPYVEGDDLHPAPNVAKMSAGTPLTDADREPWLALIRSTAESTLLDHDGGNTSNPGVVMSCSSLKLYYREILRGRRNVDGAEPSRASIPTYFVFIEGARDVLMERMEKRPGHFMKSSMLDSQLRTLESPVGEEGVVVVSLLDSTEEQVRKAMREINP